MSSVTSRGSESLARRLVAGPALVLARRWHLVALLVFFLVTCLMLAPVLHGKTLSEVSSVQSWEYPWAGSAIATHGTEPMIMHWDQLDSFYPWQVYMSRALRCALLPLWDPFEFGGVPFFANGQNGVFYPPRLASLAHGVARPGARPARSQPHARGRSRDVPDARYFRRSWFASILGGIAWMSSSFLLAWLALEHFLIVAVWLPVAMGLVDYAIRRRPFPRRSRSRSRSRCCSSAATRCSSSSLRHDPAFGVVTIWARSSPRADAGVPAIPAALVGAACWEEPSSRGRAVAVSCSRTSSCSPAPRAPA